MNQKGELEERFEINQKVGEDGGERLENWSENPYFKVGSEFSTSFDTFEFS
jgi:hypothetical protein